MGPAINVGTAKTYKILRFNGHFVCRGTVRAWTPKEEANPALLAQREEFMKSVFDKVGPSVQKGDFPIKDLTPEFEPYADEDEDGMVGSPDELEEV